MSAALAWAPEVRAAMDAGRPIVALESSVLAQGLPIPANREADALMRAAVRAAGATPAVTAMVRGVLTIGLDGDDLERFLRRDGVTKVAARDLPVAAAQGRDGATTVAGSLAACAAAGLDVFATGGIGGVHREPSYDESADLAELARTSVVVVCAGAKSILDLPATLERLDSYGVTLLGYRTDEFPGFFTASTGLSVPARVDSAAEIADILRHARRLGRPGAVLVVQPPPADAALDRETVDRAVEQALVLARTAGVRGGAVTPFLLAEVLRATEGRSLRANLSLLESNARLAGEVAVALSATP
ncbi:MAG: pseudouridine-5'-phosphate glycosidase [Gemmatimonadetes bacterium]|jgi:pseudouridine-5'-phosphate glycosidase|nr:pseudouridine-5'-phosphate glycosidase [Gemmatimonadota bacterium]MBP7549681.1 pseudouridine-5'-phosphate glycosidase [Gemmatimonadaceae bacterium]